MLKAFEENLKNIAIIDRGDFHAKVRERIGKKATPSLEKRLTNMILLLPKLLARAYRHNARPEVPSDIKRLTGYALTYFYHPKDFIPEDNRHLFGYLDDAFYIGLLYERILKSLIHAGCELQEFDKAFLKQFGLVKRSIKLTIPREASLIEGMIDNIQAGAEAALAEAFVQS